ncbi:hypothetical protein MAR_003193 [Mya arenaria]|uniref:Uncharacterized protein n=1 Tax=Mya arenaria TaxID=6604 RepID=A0ABY7G651_MYAAR|nr:hypothetical protein MAR_003193 [Mya arenaria]
MTHKLYIVRNLNRNIFLGLDWLRSRGVRVYHDLTYIPLVEDKPISSIARLRNKIRIPPQTAHICHYHIRKHPELPVDREYEVSPLESGCLCNEPGLLMTNSVSKLSGNRRLPVFLVNTTNKTLSFKKGTTIASINQINVTDILVVDKPISPKAINPEQCPQKSRQQDHDFDKTDVPPEYKQDMIRLLMRNNDLFTQTDAKLSYTDTFRMKKDTGDHSPIKLRPYRTKLNTRRSSIKL